MIPPEQLLSAFLLQAFYRIRSERQLMERLDYNLLSLVRGLSSDDPGWARPLSPNRDRLPNERNGNMFAKFVAMLLNHSDVEPLLSDEHFSVER